jgi:hypothetical protein
MGASIDKWEEIQKEIDDNTGVTVTKSKRVGSNISKMIWRSAKAAQVKDPTRNVYGIDSYDTKEEERKETEKFAPRVFGAGSQSSDTTDSSRDAAKRTNVSSRERKTTNVRDNFKARILGQGEKLLTKFGKPRNKNNFFE